ncbi:MAG: LPS-assembly protein LptD, partial [Rickettsiales bacterium]
MPYSNTARYPWRKRLQCLGMLGVMAWANTALAAPNPSADQPVLLEADRFGYDTQAAMVTAQGNAEVLQNDYIVLADRITYDQNTGVVRAEGNVTVAEPSGNVYFAENVELQNEVRQGVIRNFRARLVDDALFVAREARKVSDTVTEMDYAVYSACAVCNDAGERKIPFWKLKAQHIRYDEEAQRISYRHARFELFDVPVLYTPYF